MCFGIRISSPFHLNTLNIPIQNKKCPKNAKNACPDITLLPGGSLFGTWVPISMLRGHKILVPVHLIFSMTGAGKETVTHHISHWLWSKKLAIDQVVLDRSWKALKWRRCGGTRRRTFHASWWLLTRNKYFYSGWSLGFWEKQTDKKKKLIIQTLWIYRPPYIADNP